MNETKIITPADNPKINARNDFLKERKKNGIALPIPVDNPANVVKRNAIRTGFNK